jgi:hypothetical protein
MRLLYFFQCLSILTLSQSLLFAQSKLEFDEINHNFGDIVEGVQATHVFRFKNVSKDSVRLLNVRASCGCTTPRWTTHTIAPGDTGSVEATYNSMNRPGPFSKTITVQYDTAASQTPVILSISGNVISKAQADSNLRKEPIKIAYPDTIGNLVFDHLTHSVGELKTNSNQDFEFKVKNISDKQIRFEQKFEGKACFSFHPKTSVLKPGEESMILIKYTGSKSVAAGLTADGALIEDVSFFTDENDKAKKTLKLTGSYKRIYTPEEIAQMPTIEFETTEFDAGTILQGEQINYVFRFKNAGKSDLVIESAKASCGCTAIAPKDNIIKGGTTSQIDAKFDSRGKSGPQHKTITVKSNDPNKPIVVLNLKCNIAVDPFQSSGGAPVNKSIFNNSGGF